MGQKRLPSSGVHRHPPTPPHSWEGNRREGHGSPNGINRLQVSLKILCCSDNTWFHLNLTFLKPEANQCIFLMEWFFLSYVNEIMCLFWNLPFFKMVPPKTNFSPFLKPWADNSLTNQYSYQLFYGWGWHTSCHPISKMPIVGEGPGETPSALRCLPYLIKSFLTDRNSC